MIVLILIYRVQCVCFDVKSSGVVYCMCRWDIVYFDVGVYVYTRWYFLISTVLCVWYWRLFILISMLFMSCNVCYEVRICFISTLLFVFILIWKYSYFYVDVCMCVYQRWDNLISTLFYEYIVYLRNGIFKSETEIRSLFVWKCWHKFWS